MAFVWTLDRTLSLFLFLRFRFSGAELTRLTLSACLSVCRLGAASFDYCQWIDSIDGLT